MTLVIALKVVMLCVFLHGFPKVALAQRDDLGQALGFDGANESLRVSRSTLKKSVAALAPR